MTSKFLYFALKFVLVAISIMTFSTYAQNSTSTWKMQIGLGINHFMDSDQNQGYEFKGSNFPSINLGLQYMFKRNFGAKLDFGYNRASSASHSPEFKVNYSRVNAQGVYDFSKFVGVLPERLRAVAHAGPGLTFSNPLGQFRENKYTFLNILAGLELHYGISSALSVYGDVSYIMGLSGADKYNPEMDGFSFNGNILTVGVGISVSLSGCMYCK
ncbi:MAG: outer membrane beta-barrel protein [Flavobacteriaceae bacterium]|nr:outer membrane beta-barrel protein [Flavobacteriaceae bacterium]